MRRICLALLTVVAGVLAGLDLGGAQSPSGGPFPSPRVILSFGKDQFIPKAAIEAATGARFQSDFRGLRFLDDVSVIVLADISSSSVGPFLENRLAAWVNLGGSLLFTGGNSSFGLGGYVGTSIGSILPLVPDSRDKTGHPFGQTLQIDAKHPVLAGITIPTMGYFNETKLAGDARLLLEYRGGSKAGFAGGIQGGGRLPWPLMAERRMGAGIVLATSLDLNAAGEWKDRDNFSINLIRYLLYESKLPRSK